MDHGDPSSYLGLSAGADVVSNEGEVVGKVEHVLADEEEDLFEGIVIDCHRGPGGSHFVDAEQVDGIYERAVVLTIPGAEVEQLPTPQPAPAVMASHGVEDSESALRRKLHRAWDLMSGNY
jgi:sporulation protein YlmC with PRC-barrel domain